MPVPRHSFLPSGPGLVGGGGGRGGGSTRFTYEGVFGSAGGGVIVSNW